MESGISGQSGPAGHCTLDGWKRPVRSRIAMLAWLGVMSIVAWMFAGVFAAELDAQQSGDDPETPSLGMTRMVEQIVLPGTLLTHKKVDPETTPLVVRVVRSFPHGDSYRYDISYFGMSEGDYDLKDFLERVDGSSTDDLPSIPVHIDSILEEGQIRPHELEVGKLSGFGGYWTLILIGGTLWVAVLLALIFWGRRKPETVQEVTEQKITLAELLRPAVEKAIEGKLPREKHAELERMLLAFWQKKLGLDELDPAAAIQVIRKHESAGPLVRQVESWLHAPAEQDTDVDVAELLEPYRQYSQDDWAEFESASGPSSDAVDPGNREEQATA